MKGYPSGMSQCLSSYTVIGLTMYIVISRLVLIEGELRGRIGSIGVFPDATLAIVVKYLLCGFSETSLVP